MKYVKISYEDYNKKGDKKGCYEVVYPDGDKAYLRDGLFHRLEGPAFFRINGFCFYYLEDIEFTKSEFIEKLSFEHLKRFLLNPENF